MPSTPPDMIERADALYVARAGIENVRESVELLREAAASDYEAAWRLGRAHFFLGQEAGSITEARSHHVQGASVSLRAARLLAERVEGHFWRGVNLALLASLENPLPALLHALKARKSLERAVQIDAGFHAAGPLRVLARLQHKLPLWLGGGARRARTNFEKAINLAPASTVTRLYFAELLIEIGNEKEARTHLETILHTEPDPAWKFEIERDQQAARELLKAKVKR
ncbi:MAG: tetratricopeptide repeat protein [Pyrinomonadaceae bacterium]|nr:tetratricopeptide repeat protein [Pyrinomonadaceae bacterium]